MGGRFVLLLTNIRTPQEIAKAWYVAQGFSGNLKHEMVHNETFLRPALVRGILSTAADLGFRLYCHDMVQAYLQLLAPLSIEVYLQPNQEDQKTLGLLHDDIVSLRKPLSGMYDPSDY